MTLPGSDSGDAPRDVTGEDPAAGTFEAQSVERASSPPAYEHHASAPPPPHHPRYVPPQGYGPQFSAEPYGYGYAPPQQTTTSTMAIASLVFSILGIVPFCGGILSIVGIVLGAVALSQIKETRQEGYGLAVSGIVVGVAMLIVGLIWTIFALR